MALLDVPGCWTRIERWLAANAPDALERLPRGVSPAAVAKAEKTLGYALPRAVVQSLSIHNGSGNLWLYDHGVFMSLERMAEEWDMLVDLWDDGNNDEWAEPKGPIKKRWFTRKWLPVLDTWTGDCACVDLDPPKGGKRGQVFAWSHTGGPTAVIAPSYAAMLRQFVKELEVGLYTRKLNQQGVPYLEYSGPAA
jgi:cell wall assembly regulator SMI1